MIVPERHHISVRKPLHRSGRIGRIEIPGNGLRPCFATVRRITNVLHILHSAHPHHDFAVLKLDNARFARGHAQLPGGRHRLEGIFAEPPCGAVVVRDKRSDHALSVPRAFFAVRLLLGGMAADGEHHPSARKLNRARVVQNIIIAFAVGNAFYRLRPRLGLVG